MIQSKDAKEISPNLLRCFPSCKFGSLLFSSSWCINSLMPMLTWEELNIATLFGRWPWRQWNWLRAFSSSPYIFSPKPIASSWSLAMPFKTPKPQQSQQSKGIPNFVLWVQMWPQGWAIRFLQLPSFPFQNFQNTFSLLCWQEHC